MLSNKWRLNENLKIIPKSKCHKEVDGRRNSYKKESWRVQRRKLCYNKTCYIHMYKYILCCNMPVYSQAIWCSRVCCCGIVKSVGRNGLSFSIRQTICNQRGQKIRQKATFNSESLKKAHENIITDIEF